MMAPTTRAAANWAVSRASSCWVGDNSEEDELATAEVLRSDSEEAEDHTFTALPPLSCGPRTGSIALPIDESESAEGQVLLLGGLGKDGQLLDVASRVVKVDLATGAWHDSAPASLF